MIFTTQFEIPGIILKQNKKFSNEEVIEDYSRSYGSDLGRLICKHYPFELLESKPSFASYEAFSLGEETKHYQNQFLVVRKEEWRKFKQNIFDQVVLTRSAKETIMDLIEKIETT